MDMAYIATNPKTNDCYAICSASPDYIVYSQTEIKKWKRKGAIIELLPVDEDKERMVSSLQKRKKEQG